MQIDLATESSVLQLALSSHRIDQVSTQPTRNDRLRTLSLLLRTVEKHGHGHGLGKHIELHQNMGLQSYRS
ncbi:hypothetical protein RB195_017698 [Necator americanus]|uniref:Uncharacterized protein n=1 Tax=Necator americanus TaxID=51031 RepID=A0ABR1CA06_NECAM